jgi:hypothetical protein
MLQWLLVVGPRGVAAGKVACAFQRMGSFTESAFSVAEDSFS